MTRGELELLTDIRDFKTQVFRMVRVVYRQCIESDLDMPFAIWSRDFAFHQLS